MKALIYSCLFFTTAIGFLIFNKNLRNDKRINLLLIITFLFALAGILFQSLTTKADKGIEPFLTLGPLLSVSTYWLMRRIYKRIYHREPTYYRSSWYDPEDGRKQNWMDVLTHIIPFMSGMFLPIPIGILFR